MLQVGRTPPPDQIEPKVQVTDRYVAGGEESSSRMTLRGGTVVCCQGWVILFLTLFRPFFGKLF